MASLTLNGGKQPAIYRLPPELLHHILDLADDAASAYNLATSCRPFLAAFERSFFFFFGALTAPVPPDSAVIDEPLSLRRFDG